MPIISNLLNNISMIGHTIYADNFSNTYFNRHLNQEGKRTSSSPEPDAPSATLNLYDIDLPEIEEKYNTDYSHAKAMEYRTRGYLGLICAVHVINFLEGREKLRLNWRKEYMRCSNMISRQLGFCDMYQLTGSQNYNPEDFWFDNGNTEQPIVTKSIMDEAFKMFPMSEDTIKVSAFKDDWDHITDRFDPNPVKKAKEETVDTPPFDDSDVQVMDVEEEVKEESKKEKQKKKEDKKKEKKAEIVEVKEPKAKTDPAESEHPQDDAPLKPKRKKEVVKPLVQTADGPTLDLNDENPISEYEWETFDKLFGSKYLKGIPYTLNRTIGGAIQCVIYDTPNSYYVLNIDPGLLVGDGWNVIGTFATGNPMQTFDTIPVSASDEDICEKIFKARGYILTPAEVQRCRDRMFEDWGVYTYIDMKGMHSTLKKLTPDEFVTLGKSLSVAVENVIKAYPEFIGRYRFLNYTDSTHFTLISDEKCHSPFPMDTRYNITMKKIVVDGTNINFGDINEEITSK